MNKKLLILCLSPSGEKALIFHQLLLSDRHFGSSSEAFQAA